MSRYRPINNEPVSRDSWDDFWFAVRLLIVAAVGGLLIYAAVVGQSRHDARYRGYPDPAAQPRP